MLKVALVLGCLLSFALANPMEAHYRVARSDSDSNSNEVTNNQAVANTLNQQLFQLLLAIIQSRLTTTAAPTTTTAAPTTTTAATTTTVPTTTTTATTTTVAPGK